MRHRTPVPSCWPRLSPREGINALKEHLVACVIGQERLAQRLVLALLADGHILLEGGPGLGKTRAVMALAEVLEGTFHRIVLRPESHGAELISGGTRQRRIGAGSIFCNLLLAEGIERASADARLILLDAMAERQVTVDGATLRLPGVFMVCATRNTPPAGTRDTIVTAELDRFLLCVNVGYLDRTAERRMLESIRAGVAMNSGPSELGPLPLPVVLAARAQVAAVSVGPGILNRIIGLVADTRQQRGSQESSKVRRIRSGIGPRGSIALERCARAHAWLAGRRRVTDRDLMAVAHDALRHRFELDEGAAAAGVTQDSVIDDLLASSGNNRVKKTAP